MSYACLDFSLDFIALIWSIRVVIPTRFFSYLVFIYANHIDRFISQQSSDCRSHCLDIDFFFTFKYSLHCLFGFDFGKCLFFFFFIFWLVRIVYIGLIPLNKLRCFSVASLESAGGKVSEVKGGNV